MGLKVDLYLVIERFATLKKYENKRIQILEILQYGILQPHAWIQQQQLSCS